MKSIRLPLYADQVLVAEREQQQHRDDQGEQQLLAVAQQEPQLQAGLARDHLRQRRGAPAPGLGGPAGAGGDDLAAAADASS